MTSKRILIAHWQETFVERCQEWLTWDDFELQTVFTGQATRELLKTERFDLLILALELPDDNALDLLDFLHAEQGFTTPVLLLAQEKSLPVELVQAVTQQQYVIVAPQPYESIDLLENIWQALDARGGKGVQGNLREMELPSLITLLCNEGLQARMHIEHQDQLADLFFESGNLIHCTLNGQENVLTGKDAAYEALSWHEGYFVIHTGEPAPEHSIHENWAGVLLEGLRRADEASFDQEQLTPEELIPVESGLFRDLPEPSEPVERRPMVSVTDSLQDQLEQRLEALSDSLNPRFVLLTDRSGRLIASQGGMTHSRSLSLAALVAGSFSATSEVAEMIAQESETPRFHQSLHESEEFSFYSIKAGPSWILGLVFDPERTNLGLARLYVTRTAADLTRLFEENAGASQEQQDEVGQTMNDMFRHEVSDALEDLFG
jgi:CheY-like chemotaxis protein/predicted regulator of Ras-like GTPase activity (Roadblock/LC7/MglB family)